MCKLERYFKALQEAAENKDQAQFVFPNEDEGHNAVSMGVIFGNATNTVKMYCGKFGLFTDEFENAVNEKYGDSEFKPMDKLFKNVEDFLERKGTTFEAVIANKPQGLTSDEEIKITINGAVIAKEPQGLTSKYKDLFTKHKDKVKISVLKSEDESENKIRNKINKLTPHFAVGNNMFRFETDEIRRTAIVSFNYKEEVKLFLERFDQLKTDSLPLSL